MWADAIPFIIFADTVLHELFIGYCVTLMKLIQLNVFNHQLFCVRYKTDVIIINIYMRRFDGVVESYTLGT